MKIPKQIKVGGHIIKVVADKELPGLSGKFESSENTIYICKNQSPSQKEVTFFHELFHVFNITWSLTDLGHAMTEALSQQLYQVLKDNKMLK